MWLIAKQTVGANGASSITFSNIPQTYTDLALLVSARADSTTTARDITIVPNGASSGMSDRVLYANGASASSYSDAAMYAGSVPDASATASTFGNILIYCPNYAGSTQKSFSVDSVTENNGTTAVAQLIAGLWTGTSAITSLVLAPTASKNFVQYSTFYLYGVSNSQTQNGSVPYATGGDVITTDGTYWYHAFKASGTFTPKAGKTLSCDILTVAGGGGGEDGGSGGGGGAGGVLAFASQSLAASTAYTATVGAGAAGGTGGTPSNGSNSQFGSLTASVGGGGGGQTGGNGGSGGGGYPGTNGGSPTTGQGFAGGNGGAFSSPYSSGGGGGAGSVGIAGNSASGVSGNGGAGVNTYTNWGSLSAALTATGLGVSGYIAGGGGGGANQQYGGTNGTGGSGGGGNGGNLPTNGTANTGSGGGGSSKQPSGAGTGGNGGSGIVIIRYSVA